jgi:hypothetical protein
MQWKKIYSIKKKKKEREKRQRQRERKRERERKEDVFGHQHTFPRGFCSLVLHDKNWT